jgi:hypothetical protein
MLLTLGVLAFATLLPPSTANTPCENYTQNIGDPRFTPGQKWQYRSRSVDKGSTLTITKIDNVPGIGIVVHIVVDHITFRYPPELHGGLIEGQTLSLAMRRDSLDASVIKMLGIVETSTNDDYKKWQTNCGALTYATTVADTVKILQDEYQADIIKLNQASKP